MAERTVKILLLATILSTIVQSQTDESITVTIKACDGFTASDDLRTDTVRLQLSGENGASRFLYVNSGNQSGLPSNGESAVYVIDDAVNDTSSLFGLGALFEVKVYMDHITGLCMDFLSVEILSNGSTATYSFSTDDYFRSGVYITSECNTTFVSLPSILPSAEEVYIECIDDGLALDMNSPPSLFTLAMHSCIGDASGMTAANMLNNVHAAIVGKQELFTGYFSELVHLDADQDWNANTERWYELRLDTPMDEIVVVSLTNNHETDTLCIDDVLVDGEAALHLSANEIGVAAATSSLHAVFRYPVCATEVVGIRVDYSTSDASVLWQDSTISGLTCVNHNRLIESTCEVEQPYPVTKTTTFSITDQDKKTDEYSWGTESSLSYGTTQTQTASTTDTFSFGVDKEVTMSSSYDIVETDKYGEEIEDAPEVTVEVVVGADQSWSSTTDTTHETDKTQHDSDQTETKDSSHSDSSTNTHQKNYEYQEEITIDCTGCLDVPPSHAVSYSLVFDAFNTEITTYTDLKLTLCSAFLEPELALNDDAQSIYLYDIPGIIRHKETISCTIDFQPAQYLPNQVSCEEERRLALTHLGEYDYVPLCRADGSYDGCQCDEGKTTCFCVDPQGNLIADRTQQIEGEMIWQDVCIHMLQCENSDLSDESILASLRHGVSCAVAQELAVYNEDAFLPRCREHDASLYDGCQCNGDRCWCSAEDGQIVSGKIMDVPEDATEDQVCVEYLECENSDVEYVAGDADGDDGDEEEARKGDEARDDAVPDVDEEALEADTDDGGVTGADTDGTGTDGVAAADGGADEAGNAVTDDARVVYVYNNHVIEPEYAYSFIGLFALFVIIYAYNSLKCCKQADKGKANIG